MLLFIHVALSLIGIATGFVVIWGLIKSQRMEQLTAIFLATTTLTSVTGFLFPIHGLTPGIVVGILSLLVLAVAIYARYPAHLAGGWRPAYTISAVVAQYFNFFVLIAQSFQKVPFLRDLAPTQSEPPFAIAQVLALSLFIVLGVLATRRFRTLTPSLG